mmetsp:Transcript_2032/g.7934  ORF Transcript_2032/g.7934 Transcript_2032/m.7934 type:complete len:424 (+) Transcript_2032:628-1899(+)
MRRHAAFSRSPASHCSNSSRSFASFRFASTTARCVGSDNALCAFLMASNASLASSCAHLSGCTMSESFQYFFLITPAVSSGETPSMSYASPPRLSVRTSRMAHASRLSSLVLSISATSSGGGGPNVTSNAKSAAAASSILFGGAIGPRTRFADKSVSVPLVTGGGRELGPMSALADAGGLCVGPGAEGLGSSRSLSLSRSAMNACASSPVKTCISVDGFAFARFAALASSFFAFAAATTSGSSPSHGSRARDRLANASGVSSKTAPNLLDKLKSPSPSAHAPVLDDLTKHALSKKYSKYFRTRSSATPAVATPRPPSTARSSSLKLSRSLGNFASMCLNASAASLPLDTCSRTLRRSSRSSLDDALDDVPLDDVPSRRRRFVPRSRSRFLFFSLLVFFLFFFSFFRRRRSSSSSSSPPRSFSL